MIDLARNLIQQGNEGEEIIGWEVVFMTPFGWFDDLNKAAQRCIASDLEPNLCIVPKARAKSRTLHEVMP